MQEGRVQAPGPDGGGGRLVVRTACGMDRPAAAAPNVLQHRKLQPLADGGATGQKGADGLQPFTPGSAGLDHRHPQLLRQAVPIHPTAPAAQVVGHVQDDQGGNSQSQDGGCQAQVAVQIGGIDDQQDGVRRRQVRHLAQQHASSHALVLRPGREAVDARQIHQGDLPAILHPDLAQALFYRYSRIVGHLLPEPGEAVEERGFSAIGSSNHGDQGEAARGVGLSGRGLSGRCGLRFRHWSPFLLPARNRSVSSTGQWPV